MFPPLFGSSSRDIIENSESEGGSVGSVVVGNLTAHIEMTDPQVFPPFLPQLVGTNKNESTLSMTLSAIQRGHRLK